MMVKSTEPLRTHAKLNYRIRARFESSDYVMISVMQDATIIQAIKANYIELLDDLDERGRRRWAAVEARALGRGGITTVALATGMSDRTIRTGIKELDAAAPLAVNRQRLAAVVASLMGSRNRAWRTPWTG